MYNYEKLMAQKPTKLGEYLDNKGNFLNSLGQLIEFYENPILGDTSQVICVCHDLKLASDSDFFELDDMLADHKEYEPRFIDGHLHHGDLGPVN